MEPNALIYIGKVKIFAFSIILDTGMVQVIDILGYTHESLYSA